MDLAAGDLDLEGAAGVGAAAVPRKVAATITATEARKLFCLIAVRSCWLFH